MQFTTEQYLQAIDRELGKRATTYPKILQKMKKRSSDDDIEASMEFDNELAKQHSQVRRLKNARFLVESAPVGEEEKNFAYDLAQEALYELTREYKERQRCYPRWIKVFRMMTQETADYELAVWKSLCFWFAKKYLDLNVLPPLTKRGKSIAQ